MTNDEVLSLEGAIRTATTTTPEILNTVGARGMAFHLDVTDKTDTPNVSAINVQVPNPSGAWKTIYAFAPLGIATTGQRSFCVYPGAASSASWTAPPLQGPCPKRFRIEVVHDDADPISYSLRVELLS